jgi:GntR family transcriptional regulator/MocR family aminotransferase
MVVPVEFLDDVLRRKALADEFSPAVDQLTLAAFLQSGDYDRQIRKARSIYRARRDRLVHELSVELPELSVTGIAAGVHVLLALPPWIDDAAIARAALEDEIRVSALSDFCLERRDTKGLVVGYGRLHESAIGSAVRTLATVVRRHLADGSRPRVTALLT